MRLAFCGRDWEGDCRGALTQTLRVLEVPNGRGIGSERQAVGHDRPGGAIRNAASYRGPANREEIP